MPTARRRAGELGFHTAYTDDHLSWREPFRDGPWFGAPLTLAAAATATDRIRLGTLVTSVKPRSPGTGRSVGIRQGLGKGRRG